MQWNPVAGCRAGILIGRLAGSRAGILVGSLACSGVVPAFSTRAAGEVNA